MSTDPESHQRNQRASLAAYLAGRQEAVLAAWKAVVDADPELEIASRISLLHFRDLAPDVLKDYEARLVAGAESAVPEEPKDVRLEQHGLHRWQQGYSLRELIREWRHLQLCLLDELESYDAAHPEMNPAVMSFARRLWVQLCGEGMTRSVEEYTPASRRRRRRVSWSTCTRPWIS